MFTLKAAGTGRFHRAVAFYGMLKVPGRLVCRGLHRAPRRGDRAPACPTMAIVGSEDRWTPPPDVVAAEAAGVTVVRYEGAEHGFVHDPTRDAHRADDAADAWQRALQFLGE